MRPPWIIAAIWPPVMLAGLPDFAHPAWWGAIALAAALSVFPWTRRSGANARTDLDTEICRAAFHHHIDSITVLRDGRFIAANKAAIIATGLTDPGQFLSREVSSFAPETQPNGENSAAMARGMIAKAVATGHARGEWTRKHTDGRLIPVEVTIVPVELGGKPCVMVYYHDIAERVRAREARNALLTSLMERLDALVARVTNQVKEASRALTDDAAALVEGLDQSTARLSRASAGSREASGNVSAISAATEELSNTIAQILDQMNRRRAVTDTAVAESKAVAETISRLEQAGTHIGDVTSLISGIAAQTNMLALNATIEAARAGDAGHGFAVVATEVKTLANQIARATADVQAQVDRMQAITRETVAAIGRIGATIDQLTDMADVIGQSVAEQGAATREIAASITQASRGMTEVAAGIGDVVDMNRRCGEVAHQVSARSGDLDQEVAALRTEVSHFRSVIAAA